MDNRHIAFQGEVQLLGWAETNSRGRTVTFQLDGDAEEHPFKKFTTKHGKTAGHRFAAVLVEIGDDEMPVIQAQPVEKKLSQIAAALCKNSDFIEWADLQSWDFKVTGEDSARRFVIEVCGIASRSDLDRNEDAAATFRTEILEAFQHWKAIPEKLEL